MGDDAKMSERRTVMALTEDDWCVLRRVVREHRPDLLSLLDRPTSEWTRQDVSDLGFALGEEIVSAGLDQSGDVNARGEEMEALFSKFPQFE